jgi:hypothetical protein
MVKEKSFDDGKEDWCPEKALIWPNLNCGTSRKVIKTKNLVRVSSRTLPKGVKCLLRQRAFLGDKQCTVSQSII